MMRPVGIGSRRAGSPPTAGGRWLFLPGWLLAVGLLGAATLEKVDTSPSRAAFFATNLVRVFQITVAEPGMVSLRQHPRQAVRCTVQVGDQTWQNVGLHLKGHGSFRSLSDKPSFTVLFDEFVPDQEFEDFPTLWLNNSSQDPTCLNELVGRSVYLAAGLPTPRVTHARVELNGRDLGIYVLMEPVNKRFLRQYFKYPQGNLYKPYIQDIDQPVLWESGPDPSRADLAELVAAARENHPARQWQRLNQLLNVPQFLDYCAVEMLVAHWDGYVLNRNNYFLYHDPDTDLFNIITHDLDGAFKQSGLALTPPQNYLLTQAVFQQPEARWQYRERLAYLFTNAFQLSALSNLVEGAVARLKSAARNDQEVRQFGQWGEQAWRNVEQRHRYVVDQLHREPQPLPAVIGKPAHPSFWQARRESGNSPLELVNDGGREELQIRSESTGCSSRWRARVALPPGKYRFSGRVRALDLVSVPSDPRSGVAIRISPGEAAILLREVRGLQEFSVDFQVRDEEVPVDLNCEARYCSGDVRFDKASLQVVRLE